MWKDRSVRQRSSQEHSSTRSPVDLLGATSSATTGPITSEPGGVTRGRALASVSALLLCLVMSKCEDALFHLSVPDLALQDAGHAIIGHALVDQMLATLILAPAASAMSYSAQQMPTHELFRIFPLPLPDRDRTSTFCSVLPRRPCSLFARMQSASLLGICH